MGLIHFPTPIPISGKSLTIFRGRKVRCIKQTAKNQPEDELLQGLRAYIGGAEPILCLVDLRLKAYIARQEKLSNREPRTQRGYPSVAKAKRLLFAVEFVGMCLRPVLRTLGLAPYSDSAEYISYSSLA